MNRFLTLGMALLLVSASAFAAEPPEGFTALFNGKDYTGWIPVGHFSPYTFQAFTAEQKADFIAKNMPAFQQHWTVENGEMVNDGYGAYATTEKEYKDFELLIEYKTVALADSGIYLRGTPQVQIWDTRKEGGKWNLGADKGSGGLWNNSKNMRDPLVHADKPFGEWNQLRIILKGDVCNVWLNGKQVVKDTVMENYFNRSIPLIEKGPIQLQTHGGEIRWRNIFIKEL